MFLVFGAGPRLGCSRGEGGTLLEVETWIFVTFLKSIELLLDGFILVLLTLFVKRLFTHCLLALGFKFLHFPCINFFALCLLSMHNLVVQCLTSVHLCTPLTIRHFLTTWPEELRGKPGASAAFRDRVSGYGVVETRGLKLDGLVRSLRCERLLVCVVRLLARDNTELRGDFRFGPLKLGLSVLARTLESKRGLLVLS